MINIEFNTILFAANELTKSGWACIKPMLDNLTDEEIEKIPSILSEPSVMEAAKKYGITDILSRNDKWIYIYCISGCIFKGETKQPPND